MGHKKKKGDRTTTISKHLNWICRHQAEKLKLPVRPDGYIPLWSILALEFFATRQVKEGEIKN